MKKFDKVMHEYGAGRLSSSSGKKVTDKKQALAIAFSEARRHPDKAAEGKTYTGPVLSVVGDRSPKDKKYDTQEYMFTNPGQGGVTVVAKMKKGETPTTEGGIRAILSQIFQSPPTRAGTGLAVGAGNQPPGHASTLADGGRVPALATKALNMYRNPRPRPVASSVSRPPMQYKEPGHTGRVPASASTALFRATSPSYKMGLEVMGMSPEDRAAYNAARQRGGRGLQTDKLNRHFETGKGWVQGRGPTINPMVGGLTGRNPAVISPTPATTPPAEPVAPTLTPEQQTMQDWIAGNPALAKYFTPQNLALAGMQKGATVSPMMRFQADLGRIKSMPKMQGGATTGAPTLPAEFMNLPFLQSLLGQERGSSYQRMAGTAQPFGPGVKMPNWQGVNYYKYLQRPEWQQQMVQGIASGFGMPPEQAIEQMKRATLNTLGNPVSSQFVAGMR